MLKAFVIAMSVVGFLVTTSCGALHPVSADCEETRQISSVRKKQCEEEAAIAKSNLEPGYMRAGGH